MTKDLKIDAYINISYFYIFGSYLLRSNLTPSRFPSTPPPATGPREVWDFTSAKDAATLVGRHLQKGDLRGGSLVVRWSLVGFVCWELVVKKCPTGGCGWWMWGCFFLLFLRLGLQKKTADFFWGETGKKAKATKIVVGEAKS